MERVRVDGAVADDSTASGGEGGVVATALRRDDDGATLVVRSSSTGAADPVGIRVSADMPKHARGEKIDATSSRPHWTGSDFCKTVTHAPCNILPHLCRNPSRCTW